MPSTTIDTDRGCLTFINMFTVDPQNQDRLTEVLQQATDEVMSKFPGFISASLHKSTDGKMVINYLQMQSRESFDAFFRDERAVAHMLHVRSIIESSDRHFFEVASVHHAS